MVFTYFQQSCILQNFHEQTLHWFQKACPAFLAQQVVNVPTATLTGLQKRVSQVTGLVRHFSRFPLGRLWDKIACRATGFTPWVGHSSYKTRLNQRSCPPGSAAMADRLTSDEEHGKGVFRSFWGHKSGFFFIDSHKSIFLWQNGSHSNTCPVFWIVLFLLWCFNLLNTYVTLSGEEKHEMAFCRNLQPSSQRLTVVALKTPMPIITKEQALSCHFVSSWDHLPFFALKFRWLSFHCSVVADLGLLGFPVLTKWPNSANGAEEVDNYPSNQIQDSKENIYQLQQPWNWEKRRTLLVEANRLYICVDIHLYDMYIF